MGLKRSSYDVEKVENIFKGLLREKIYTKYADKFELKFHHHFDGEILIKQKGGEEVLELFGAHNHEINGNKIQIGIIRKPSGVKSVHNLPNDVPFKANVNVKYNTGIIKKTNTSSFSYKLDIKRVKQEIALVYDEMLKSGRSFPYENNKFFFLDSTNSFEIQIEFDKFGNLTSAYPKI
jgi:hypothetical protein